MTAIFNQEQQPQSSLWSVCKSIVHISDWHDLQETTPRSVRYAPSCCLTWTAHFFHLHFVWQMSLNHFFSLYFQSILTVTFEACANSHIIQMKSGYKAQNKHMHNFCSILSPKRCYFNCQKNCMFPSSILWPGIRVKLLKLLVINATSTNKCILKLWHGHLWSRG